MPRSQPDGAAEAATSPVRMLDLSFDNTDAEASALNLVAALRPEWTGPDARVEFVRFTDGITNTLLKAVNRRDGLSSDDELNSEAVLLRAYGHGTDVLIDRQREAQNHELLMRHRLAPELLARFRNGMIYRYIPGRVTSPADLRRPEIYLAVARRLAEWHALVPCLPAASPSAAADGNGVVNGSADHHLAIDQAAPGKSAPNIWTVIQKWLLALPTNTEAERSRAAELQTEFTSLVAQLSQRPGLGKNGLVFAHCDLLSGNVIIEPGASASASATSNGIGIGIGIGNGIGNGNGNGNGNGTAKAASVSFIDYEYATPSPAAFDLANHFAEWGGFECDPAVLPTRQQRADFIREYIRVYYSLLPRPKASGDDDGLDLDLDAEADKLCHEVDTYRGLPGFYWGIWALIQATISQIKFDYAAYAEVRLAEYYAWRDEENGARAAAAKEPPAREKRWWQ